MLQTTAMLRIAAVSLATALGLAVPSVAGGQSSASGGSYVPSFNSNVEAATDNIADAAETVQGAVDSLKAANDMVTELTKLLAELEAEKPGSSGEASKAANERKQKVLELKHKRQRAVVEAKTQRGKLEMTKQSLDAAMADYRKYKHKVPNAVRKKVEKMYARAVQLYKAAPRPAPEASK